MFASNWTTRKSGTRAVITHAKRRWRTASLTNQAVRALEVPVHLIARVQVSHAQRDLTRHPNDRECTGSSGTQQASHRDRLQCDSRKWPNGLLDDIAQASTCHTVQAR